MDGGCKVFDYEISYKVCHVEKVGKREIRHYADMPPLLCSRWVMKPPVATYGFTLEDLEANTEYSDIVVKCRNKIGWGPPSKPLEPVHTLEAIPPTKPLFFQCVKCTSAIIAFTWGEPANEGGSPVVDYVLTYTEVALKDNQEVGVKSESEKYEEIDHEVSVGGSHCYHSLLDLRGDTNFKNWEIRAITEAGLKSEPSTHANIRTKEPTRRQLVQKEILRTKQTQGEFIDSDFYQGFVQREEKLAFLGRLEEELASLPEDLDETLFVGSAGQKKAKKRWGKLKFGAAASRGLGFGANGGKGLVDDDAINEQLMPGFTRRKTQFTYRIKQLEEEIEQLEKDKNDAVSNRSYLTYQMGHMQTRIIALQAEMDRVATFKGDEINSDVIHGTDQRFTVMKLKADLIVELDNAQGSIAAWKAEVIHGDQMKIVFATKKVRKIEALKDRRAAYKSFMNQANRSRKFNSRFNKDTGDLKLQYFEQWVENAQTRVRVRNVMLKVWGDQSSRFKKAAWHKWVYGSHAGGGTTLEDKYNIISAGGKMLVKNEEGRMENVKDMAEILVKLTEIQKDATLGQYTKKQREALENNRHFGESELGHTLGTYERDLAHMIQGDAFFNIRKYDEAMDCYHRQLEQIKEEDDPNEPDVKVLAMLYGRKGKVELARRAWDRAILDYERQRSLATEIESDVEWAGAFMGLGEGYLGKGDYQSSRVLFEQAMLKCIVIGDKVRQARAYRGIQVSYERLHNPLYAARYKERADNLMKENQNKIIDAFAAMEDFKARLIDTTASLGEVIHLERITAGCIRMRADKVNLEEKIEAAEERLEEQEKQVRLVKELLRKIDDQLEEAKNTDKDEMTSALIHEKEQMFEVEELKMRLAEKRKRVVVDEEEQVRRHRRMNQNIINKKDDLVGLEQDLLVEQGPLMKQVMKSRILRCMGLNPSNTAGNEVTGTATGGIEYIAGAEINNINVYDIHTGTLKLVFTGDEEGRHVGDPHGHTSVITCILFHDAKIYTGSMDTTIMCWDIETEEREWVGLGHEATVTCIYVDAFKLISGAADTKIIIWDKDTGDMLKLVHGHSRGVSCIQCGPTWFVSGGTEGEVRVWTHLAVEEDPKYKLIKCKRRLKGHGCKVTVVKYGKLEIISGDAEGKIIVWWLKTGDIVQKCQAHKGVVTDLQFDATKIVSSGVDHNLQVIDITTGEVLQTLRGHEGPVVGLAFDTVQILSASSDGTLRHWEWGSANKRADKLHLYDSGDNLAKISRKYKVPIGNIIKWNGITDVKKMYIGQKLIVQKGNPDEPTEAELKASTKKEQNRQREAKVDDKIKLAMQKAEEEMAKANGQTQESNPLEIDSYLEKATMASRLQADAGGLLPSEYLEVDEEEEKQKIKHNDFTSLASRIKHDGKTKNQLRKKVDVKKQWEQNVKNTEYKPDRRAIADQMGMFLLYQVVDELISRDIVKEVIANDMFNESLGGRFFNHSKGKKPVYKAARRFGNALDFAREEDIKDDGSMGGLSRISRISEEVGSLGTVSKEDFRSNKTKAKITEDDERWGDGKTGDKARETLIQRAIKGEGCKGSNGGRKCRWERPHGGGGGEGGGGEGREEQGGVHTGEPSTEFEGHGDSGAVRDRVQGKHVGPGCYGEGDDPGG